MKVKGKKGGWLGFRVVSWQVRVDNTTLGLGSMVVGKHGGNPEYEGG